MTINFKRGFTLIELLVVIAIIGILASVVLASLNSAREKGSNAAARSSLNNARAQAELFYDAGTTNTYEGVCASGPTATPPGIDANLDGADDAVTAAPTCHDTSSGWAAAIELNGTPNTWYCVDSTGYGGDLTASPALSDTNVTCL